MGIKSIVKSAINKVTGKNSDSGGQSKEVLYTPVPPSDQLNRFTNPILIPKPKPSGGGGGGGGEPLMTPTPTTPTSTNGSSEEKPVDQIQLAVRQRKIEAQKKKFTEDYDRTVNKKQAYNVYRGRADKVDTNVSRYNQDVNRFNSMYSFAPSGSVKSSSFSVNTPIQSYKDNSLFPNSKINLKTNDGLFKNSFIGFESTGIKKPVQTGIMIINENEKSLIGNRGAFVVNNKSNYLDAVDTGVILSNFPSTRVSPFSIKPIGGLNKEELLTERTTATFAQNVVPYVLNNRKESYTEADVIKFNSDIDLINKNSVLQARSEYKTLSIGDRSKAMTSSVVGTVPKFVAGTGEFGLGIVSNLGQKDVSKGLFKVDSIKFSDNSFLGRTTSSEFLKPSTSKYDIKQIGPQAGLTGGAIVFGASVGAKNLFKAGKKEGYGLATAETIKPFSPLSLKNQVYMPKSNEFVQSSFSATKGNKVERMGLITAKDTNTGISGFFTEDLTIGKGGKITSGIRKDVIETPFIEVRGGGAYTRQGSKVVETKTTLFNKNIFSEKDTDITVISKEGGFYNMKIPGITSGGTSRGFSQPTRQFTSYDGGALVEDFVPFSTKARVSNTFGLARTPSETSPFTIFKGGKSKRIFEPIVESNVRTLSQRTYLDPYSKKVKRTEFKADGFADIGNIKVIGQRPTTRIKVGKPTVQGVDINLNKLIESRLPKEDAVGLVRGSGRKSNPSFIRSLDKPTNSITKQIQSKPVGSIIPNIQRPIITQTSFSNQPALFTGIQADTTYAGKGLYERNEMSGFNLQANKVDSFSDLALSSKPNYPIMERPMDIRIKESAFSILSQPSQVKSDTKTLQRNVLIPRLSLIQEQGLNLKPLLKPKLEPRLKQTPKQTPIFNEGIISPPPPFKPNFPRPPRGGFGFGGFPLGLNFKSLSKRQSRFNNFGLPKRQPSLVAIGQNIRSTKTANLEGSALNIRPIIVNKRKRGKNVRKVKSKK